MSAAGCPGLGTPRLRAPRDLDKMGRPASARGGVVRAEAEQKAREHIGGSGGYVPAPVSIPPGLAGFPSRDAHEGEEPAAESRAESSARSVLQRIAAVIDSFDDCALVLSLNDLSHRTGLPKSTVHRFAEQLRGLGWLEREAGGYRIGVRLFEVGGLAARRNRLRDKAIPHLQQLAFRTGLAVQLGILDRCEVLYLERILIRGFDLPTRDGGRMPAYCTGLGKSMLAWAGDAEIDRVIEAGLPPRTPYTVVVPELFRQELASIRRNEYALDREECERGISCVAAPIRGAGRAIGAISVTGPAARVDVNHLAPIVRETARAIWFDLFGSSSANS